MCTHACAQTHTEIYYKDLTHDSGDLRISKICSRETGHPGKVMSGSSPSLKAWEPGKPLVYLSLQKLVGLQPQKLMFQSKPRHQQRPVLQQCAGRRKSLLVSHCVLLRPSLEAHIHCGGQYALPSLLFKMLSSRTNSQIYPEQCWTHGPNKLTHKAGHQRGHGSIKLREKHGMVRSGIVARETKSWRWRYSIVDYTFQNIRLSREIT